MVDASGATAVRQLTLLQLASSQPGICASQPAQAALLALAARMLSNREEAAQAGSGVISPSIGGSASQRSRGACQPASKGTRDQASRRVETLSSGEGTFARREETGLQPSRTTGSQTESDPFPADRGRHISTRSTVASQNEQKDTPGPSTVEARGFGGRAAGKPTLDESEDFHQTITFPSREHDKKAKKKSLSEIYSNPSAQRAGKAATAAGSSPPATSGPARSGLAGVDPVRSDSARSILTRSTSAPVSSAASCPSVLRAAAAAAAAAVSPSLKAETARAGR